MGTKPILKRRKNFLIEMSAVKREASAMIFRSSSGSGLEGYWHLCQSSTNPLPKQPSLKSLLKYLRLS